MPHTMFVSCAEDRSIRTVRLEDDGTMRPLAATPVPGAEGTATSLPLARSADGTRLYAALRTPPYPVVSYAIGPDASLSRMASAALPHAMAYLSADAAGRFVFGASYQGALVSRSPVDADGAVRAGAEALATPPNPHCILPSPCGRFLHVPCLGADAILRLDAGSFTEAGRAITRKGAGPRHLRFAPGGAHAYCLNELDATIDVWCPDAAGALGHAQTVALLPPGTKGRIAAADLHLTPDGRFLFASERLTDILSAWHRDPASGLLSPRGTVAAEAGPRGFAVSPCGRFLVCAGQTSHHLGSYAIDPASGALAPLHRLAVGPNPNWIEWA